MSPSTVLSAMSRPCSKNALNSASITSACLPSRAASRTRRCASCVSGACCRRSKWKVMPSSSPVSCSPRWTVVTLAPRGAGIGAQGQTVPAQHPSRAVELLERTVEAPLAHESPRAREIPDQIELERRHRRRLQGVRHAFVCGRGPREIKRRARKLPGEGDCRPRLAYPSARAGASGALHLLGNTNRGLESAETRLTAHDRSRARADAAEKGLDIGKERIALLQAPLLDRDRQLARDRSPGALADHRHDL